MFAVWSYRRTVLAINLKGDRVRLAECKLAESNLCEHEGNVQIRMENKNFQASRVVRKNWAFNQSLDLSIITFSLRYVTASTDPVPLIITFIGVVNALTVRAIIAVTQYCLVVVFHFIVGCKVLKGL